MGNDRPREHLAMLHKLERILSEEDPVGLRAAGAPEDEYRPEAQAIVPRLPGCRGVADVRILVHDTFVRFFDARIAGPVESYQHAAERIWALIEEGRQNQYPSSAKELGG